MPRILFKCITVSTRKKENIILFVDLVDCFQGLEEDEMEDMEIDGYSGECSPPPVHMG